MNQRLDIGVALVISASVVTMVVELEYESYRSQVLLGIDSAAGAWGSNAKDSFKAVDHVFNALFLVELLARLWVLRCKYFLEMLNFIDFFLVLSTSIQLYILEPLDVSAGGKFTLFRMIRFLRFT